MDLYSETSRELKTHKLEFTAGGRNLRKRINSLFLKTKYTKSKTSISKIGMKIRVMAEEGYNREEKGIKTKVVSTVKDSKCLEIINGIIMT